VFSPALCAEATSQLCRTPVCWVLCACVCGRGGGCICIGYVCVYVCVYVYIHACMHTFMHTYIHAYILYIYVCVCVCARACVCVRARLYVTGVHPPVSRLCLACCTFPICNWTPGGGTKRHRELSLALARAPCNLPVGLEAGVHPVPTRLHRGS